MALRLVLAVFFFITSPFLYAQQMSADDIFLKAFGQKRTLPNQMKLSLNVAGRLFDDVQVYFTKGSQRTPQIDSATLIKALMPVAQSEVVERLYESIDEQNRLSALALSRVGISMTVNEANLSLDVDVPLEIQKQQRLALVPSNKKPSFDQRSFRHPAKYSGYINLNSSVGYQTVSSLTSSIERKDRTPLELQLEGVLNASGKVLETQYTYYEQADNHWGRDHTRLTWDSPATLERTVLGDLAYPTTGYQNGLSLGGINVTKAFFLDPFQAYYSTGEQNLTLNSRSEIEVYRGKLLMNTFTLPPGEYRLTDLQLEEGANDLRLKITDSFGSISESAFTLFHDDRLLQTGVSEYSYTLGVPSLFSGKGRDYDTNTWVVSGYVRRGMLPDVTLGANYQGYRDHHMLGGDALVATPLGNISFTVARSSHQRTDGHAIRALYKNRFGDISQPYRGFSWNWSLEHRSKQFRTLDQPEEEMAAVQGSSATTFAPFAYRFSSQASAPFDYKIHFEWNFDYLMRHPKDRWHYSTGVGLRRGLSFGGTFSVHWSFSKNSLGETENAFFASAYIPFSHTAGTRHKALSSQYMSDSDSSYIDYNVSALGNLGADSLSGNVRLNNNTSNKRLSGSTAYRQQRHEGNLSVSASKLVDTSSTQTDIGFRTALVFADGMVTFSRPVSDSFAIVALDDSVDLSNQRVAVTRQGSIRYAPDSDLPTHYLGIADKYGPAVLPELNAYAYRSFSADFSQMPLGVDTTLAESTVYPSYRSGFLIQAGGAMGVIVGGALVSPDGTPLNLKGGQVTSLTLDRQSAQPFFTNRKGRFRLMPLPPGKYKLEIFEYSNMDIILQIKQGKEGALVKLGRLKLGETRSLSID